MSRKTNTLRSEQRSSSDEDRTSLSDLRKLVEKQFAEVMSAIHGVNGRVMKLEHGMGLLLVGTKSNMIESKPQSSGPRCLKLVFRNKISLPVFSGEEIRGEGGKYLEVALVDDVTGNVVDFGAEASAHVEIVALEGDSEYCERDTWVIGKYKNKIDCVSEEKRPVLVGKVKLELNKGIASLVNIKFRNSSNHNSGVFKLGAKVVDSLDGTLVKEAMTESFFVKDFREKYKQKHYPPSLSDEIWRLDNIQKGGNIYDRVKEKVKTVEDFLIQLLKDPEGLKSLFCLPEKKWNVTVKHAQTCTSQKVYCIINSQEMKGVVFDCSGDILGVIKEWNCVHWDMLPQQDKAEARGLFATTIKKEEVKGFDNEDSLLQYLTFQSTAVSTNPPRPENKGSDEVETSKIGEFDQANVGAASQDASSSKHPSRVTVCQEVGATGYSSGNPTAFTGVKAPLHGPICIDQSNIEKMNLDTPSTGESVLPDAEPSVPQRIDFQDMITFSSPTGGGLEAPVFSPYNDEPKSFDDCLRDALLSWSPSKGGVCNDVEASETNCFLSPDKLYPPLGPLWTDQYNAQPSSSFLMDNPIWPTQVHAAQSYMTSEGTFVQTKWNLSISEEEKRAKKRKQTGEDENWPN